MLCASWPYEDLYPVSCRTQKDTHIYTEDTSFTITSAVLTSYLFYPYMFKRLISHRSVPVFLGDLINESEHLL